MAVYSNVECTQVLGTDGFEQTRQAFEALPYMGSNCVPATGECFVLNAECRAAYKASFDHWEDEYGNEAVAIRISAWIGDATATSSDEEEGDCEKHRSQYHINAMRNIINSGKTNCTDDADEDTTFCTRLFFFSYLLLHE